MSSESPLLVVETRSRAKETGYAFGFRGKLWIPFVISIGVSIFFLTLVIDGDEPLWIKLLEGGWPVVGTTLYLLICKVGRPPGWDIDWLRTFVLGRGFGPARHQPIHPMFQE